MSLLFFIFCPKCNKCPTERLQTRKTERIIYISMHTKVFFAKSPLQTPATYAPENLQKNIWNQWMWFTHEVCKFSSNSRPYRFFISKSLMSLCGCKINFLFESHPQEIGFKLNVFGFVLYVTPYTYHKPWPQLFILQTKVEASCQLVATEVCCFASKSFPVTRYARFMTHLLAW